MAVSYKKLQHLMIDRNISNAELMRRANISANIITKIRTGQYIALVDTPPPKGRGFLLQRYISS